MPPSQLSLVYSGRIESRADSGSSAASALGQLGINIGSDAPPLQATLSRDASGQESLKISQLGQIKVWSVRLKDRFGVRTGGDIKFYPLDEGLAYGCTGFILPRTFSLLSMQMPDESVTDSFQLDPSKAVQINMVNGMEFPGEYDVNRNQAEFKLYGQPKFTVDYVIGTGNVPSEIIFREFQPLPPELKGRAVETNGPIFTAVWKKVSESPLSINISPTDFTKGVSDATVYKGRKGYGYSTDSKQDPWKHYVEQEQRWARVEKPVAGNPGLNVVMGVSIAAGIAVLLGAAWVLLRKR